MTNGIDVKGYVFLDETTVFEGDISAETVVLEGCMSGKIEAGKKVYLKRTARMEGEIHTKHFFVEEGSVCKADLEVNLSPEIKEEIPKKHPEPELPKRTEKISANLF
ncbi:MAG: polymer-forming cytoskeletal protein [Balneolaceae bacterium]|nr:polymer-forming cytoskeletal protein [Balneolaceae bacterium]